MSDSEEDNSAELPAIEPNPITVPNVILTEPIIWIVRIF